MIEKIMAWLRGREASPTVAARAGEMENALALWAKMYEDKAPWTGGDTHSLNLSASVSAEMARLITLEMSSCLSGSPRADFLNLPYQELISSLRRYVEYGCAKGGVVFKPYVCGSGIRIEAIHNGCFFPTEFDSSQRLTGAAFAEQITRNGQIYTRIEQHGFEDGTYTIHNHIFCSGSDASLGRRALPGEVAEWAGLEPEIRLVNIQKPLFGYFRTPFANNIDSGSPLGVSVFSRCVDLIRQADEQYSRLLWEFEGSELAVDASCDVLARAGEDIRLPKRSERLFRRFDTHDPDFYSVFNPQIRDASILNGLNAILRKIEFGCGLAYGTISDIQAVQKTAQEILESKQRSYSVVRDMQKALEAALKDLLYAMDALTDIYRLAPQGKVLPCFEWDDSIISDKNTEFDERMRLVEQGMLKPELVTAWYFGCAPEQARDMMSSSGIDNL